MPALSTNLISWMLRTTGVYRRMFAGGEKAARHWQKAQAGPVVPTARLMRKCHAASREFEGRQIWEFAPKERAPSATILFWHGGGYIYPPAAVHWGFIETMVRKHGWRMIVPLYPLAPSHNVDDAARFALAFYRDLLVLERKPPSAMAGDSAGAGLTSALAMLIRDAGLALPEKLVLICPWLNAVPNHPDQPAIEPRDALLSINGITEAGQLYAGPNPRTDPRVSPIHGNWSGLPPILSYGGGDDILVTDARALKVKMPNVEYRELGRMIHDWPIATFRESRTAQAEMAAYVGAN